MTLAIVTATTNPRRAEETIHSWGSLPLVIVLNGIGEPTEEIDTGGIAAHWIVSQEYLGSVPAFRVGVNFALEQTDADIIACLHDDFEIMEESWADRMIRHFEREPNCGLLGFGGAIGLGAPDLYQTPYDPMQLARSGFRSNLVDAEAHGVRSLLAEKVACLDGFSQVGRRAFWEGVPVTIASAGLGEAFARVEGNSGLRPWSVLDKLGFIHHFYDGALGCLAKRYGWDTWYLPLRGRHHGGQTAVGDQGYQQWAAQQVSGGDHGFWKEAHRIGYDAFRDVLPLRV
jgi:hypothetical protein